MNINKDCWLYKTEKNTKTKKIKIGSLNLRITERYNICFNCIFIIWWLLVLLSLFSERQSGDKTEFNSFFFCFFFHSTINSCGSVFEEELLSCYSRVAIEMNTHLTMWRLYNGRFLLKCSSFSVHIASGILFFN